jgi:hypothetical protein
VICSMKLEKFSMLRKDSSSLNAGYEKLRGLTYEREYAASQLSPTPR